MAAVVYLLRSQPTGRTYVGCSVHLPRRLRQHNGGLAGGAAQTATGRPWALVCTVEGFSDRRDALRFEFAWRRAHRRLFRGGGVRYDVAGRRAALATLLSRRRATAGQSALTVVEAATGEGGGGASAGAAPTAPPADRAA